MRKALLSIYMFVHVFGCTVAFGQPIDLTKEQWSDDLAYLAKALPQKHAAIYHSVKKETFENAIADLKEKILSVSDNEIMVELIKIVAMVKDGHTDITPKTRVYPARFGYYGETIYLLSASEENKKAVGGRLIKIGKTDIREAVQKIKPLVDGDNEMEELRKIPAFLSMAEILNGLHLIEDMDKAVFTIISEEGEEIRLTLQPVEDMSKIKMISAREKANSSLPLYTQHVDKNYWFTYLAETKTLYFQYNVCNDQKGEKSIAQFSKDLFDFADKNTIDYFILDLRHNPGGNFKKSTPIVEGIQKRPGLNKRGKFFIFTSRNTGSAATVTGAQLKISTEAIFIGGVSRSNPNFTNNGEHFQLPNSKLSVGYTEALHKPFPSLGSVLPVDILLENSFEDYRAGRDRFLETVWSNQKK
jgi:C-terminal processing protease CtpA/Prc